MHIPVDVNHESRSHRRYRGWIGRITAALISTVVSLLLLELVARGFGLGYGYAPLVDHSVWHHWHESNYECLCWGPHDQFGGFVNRFNSQGLAMSEELSPKDPGMILFLGDSFTEALQVPERKRFASLVGHRVNVPLGNLGCSSFSPILSRLVLEHFLHHAQPRIVFLQLYANDLDDDLRYRRQAIFGARGPVAVPGNEVSGVARLCRRSYLFRFSRKALLSHEFAKRMQERTGGQWGSDAWSPMFAQSVVESVDNAHRLAFETSVAEIQDVCRRSCAELIVFGIPDRGSLLADTPDYFNDYVADVCRKVGARWIDLVPAFQATDASRLYFPQDIHLTQEGHAIVADIVATAIRLGTNGSDEIACLRIE